MKLPINYKSAADAGADGKDCQGVHTAAGTKAPFAMGDRADIVK